MKKKQRRTGGEKEGNREGRRQEERKDRKRKRKESRKEKGNASFSDQRKMQQLMASFLLGCFPDGPADFPEPGSDFCSHALLLSLVYKPWHQLNK